MEHHHEHYGKHRIFLTENTGDQGNSDKPHVAKAGAVALNPFILLLPAGKETALPKSKKLKKRPQVPEKKAALPQFPC